LAPGQVEHLARTLEARKGLIIKDSIKARAGGGGGEGGVDPEYYTRETLFLTRREGGGGE
jgi:hypothetical protein